MSARRIRSQKAIGVHRPLQWSVAALACCLAGCTLDALLNQTASLGSDSAGQRGTVRVLFINNTPHRALLTAGVYDPTDDETDAEFVQFSTDRAASVLEGNSSSSVIELPCARAFSVGGAGLIELIKANNEASELQSAALVQGVGFSSAALGEDGDDEPDQGFAPARTFLIGADFPCNALLIVRLEIDDLGPDPFLVDFSYIPSAQTR